METYLDHGSSVVLTLLGLGEGGREVFFTPMRFFGDNSEDFFLKVCDFS